MSNSNQQCPVCAELGHDTGKDNLFLVNDGSGYTCRMNGTYHAPVFYPLDEDVTEQKSSNNRYTVEELYSLNSSSIASRKLNSRTVERYGVKIGYSATDKSEYLHAYPIHKKGKLTAYKTRTLPKSFSVVGDAKGKIDLFGQHLVSGGKNLLICGGELDALSAYQLLYDYSNGKYEPAVVSLPKGENSTAIADNLDYISGFKKIIIYTDMDEVGRKVATEIAHLVGLERAVIMATSEKDASDMLIEGKKEEFYTAYFNAQPHKPEGIISGADISLESLREPMPEGYSIPYPLLQNKLHGLRKGELITLTAGSGVGKSTLARELAYHLMKEHKLCIGNIFLEEVKEHTAVGYIALDNDVPIAKLRVSPNTIPKEDYEQSYNELINNGRWYGIDHFGSLASDELMDKLRHLALVAKCDFIFLDHLSMVISGQASKDERKDIDLLMTKLASFVNETGVGVISVVHLSRNRAKTAFNEGGNVSLSDLRGSAGLEQLSWSVIALERNQQAEDNPNISRIRLLKNRIWGFTGVTDTCEYSFETGRLLPIVDIESTEY